MTDEKEFDCIIVGAGLSGGLLAWRLTSRHPSARILLVDQDKSIGGNHTWSCFESDLRDSQRVWWRDLIAHRWDGYEVKFPQLKRRFDEPYMSISSDQFRDVLSTKLRNVKLGRQVTSIGNDRVVLDGNEVLVAPLVIDARGWRAEQSAITCGYQSFVGQEWIFEAAHNLTELIMMDATIDQRWGYDFIYVLPTSAESALIEITSYHKASVDAIASMPQQIEESAKKHSWRLRSLIRQEQGRLAIPLSGSLSKYIRDELSAAVPIGVRALDFHPVTGYSLPKAIRNADFIAGLYPLETNRLRAIMLDMMKQRWYKQAFLRALNRMLIRGAEADEGRAIMQKFYRLPEATISRFYADALTPVDALRILSGKPPIKVMTAVKLLAGK